MDIPQIYSNAILKTQTSSLNYPLDAAAMIDFNQIYHDFCNRIRALNENYFYGRMKKDTIPYQPKYTLGI